MKKALFVATIAGFLSAFEQNDMKLLQKMGYEVHIATNTSVYANKEKFEALVKLGPIIHDIPFQRNPFKKKNIEAYKRLKSLMASEHFDIVHCHTPVGGVLGRMAAHATHVSQVIYTAHGFHFYTGAPKKNWILFYPVEKFCSRWTNVLITLNNEDFQRAQKFHAGRVERIHGVGVELNRFSHVEINRQEKRNELGVKDNELLLLSVGELDWWKNHAVVLKAMKALAPKGFKYIVAGRGGLLSKHEKYIEDNNIKENVKFLGFRMDIPELLQAADIFVFPSYVEGLSVALMEAVAAKKPIACSKVRGNVDTVITPESYFTPSSSDELVKVVEKITSIDTTDMVEQNYRNLLQYQLSEVSKEMKKIYETVDRKL